MIPPSTRLRRALQLRSLTLVQRIILCNPQLPELIRNPDPSDRNSTSLHQCAKLGLADIAKFLLQHGHESPGVSRDLDGLTPLMVAAQAGSDEDNAVTNGRIEVGKLLISHLPDSIEIQDKEGMDAFTHATQHGTLPLLHVLLAIPHHNTLTLLTTRDLAGNTPLHHASAAGQLKTLRLLVSLGADHTARNDTQWTPVDYSASVAAEVYLKGLVREREGRRAGAAAGADGRSGASSAAGHHGAGGSSGGDARGTVRLVQSDDEDDRAEGGADSDFGEPIRGRARTAT